MAGAQVPDDALRNRSGSDVALALTLDEKGAVKDISVLKGEPEFSKAATEAVRTWKYAPYPQAGKNTVLDTVVSVHFRVAEDGKPEIFATGVQVVKGEDHIVGPELVTSAGPQYSSAAKAVRYQGLCVLALTVGEDGAPRDVRVARPLGFGLDEEAVDAVKRLKFTPPSKDGKPVPIGIDVQVQFRYF